MAVFCLTLFCVFVLATDVDAFRQNDYQIHHHRLEVIRYNHKYVRDFTASLVPLNRTARAFNASFNLLVDLNNTVVHAGQVYKFASNEYRLFPLRMAVDDCKELKENAFGAADIMNYTNIRVSDNCSLKKGYYYVYKYRPDETKFPPHAPAGDYKLVVNMTYKSEDLGEFHWYGSVKSIEKWLRI